MLCGSLFIILQYVDMLYVYIGNWSILIPPSPLPI